VFSIAGVTLLRLGRDRISLFFTFLLPLLIIVLLGYALPGDRLVIGVVQPDPSGLAGKLREALDDADGVTTRTYDDVAALRKAVRRNDIPGGIVIPADYDARLRAGQPAKVSLVVDQSNRDAAAVRSRVGAIVDAQNADVLAARVTARVAGLGFDDALATARRVSESNGSLQVETTTAGSSALGGVSVAEYATAGELVLFIFLIAITGAGEIVLERSLGVTRRMVSTPTRILTILTGTGLGRFSIAMAQTLVIVLGGMLLFDVSWGQPLGLIVLVGTFALVATSVCLLVATIARTPEQATSIGPPVGIILGALGGCMFPLEITPPAFQAVAHLTPQAWALDGLLELMGKGATLADILPQVLVLLGFAAVILPLALWRLRRTLVL
jgi:ABC-2 type transport system permease protein